MSILDNQSEPIAIAARSSPAAVMAVLVANQTFVSFLLGVAIALVTLFSVTVQVRNSNRRDERERLQAERDALAYELREKRAAERHQATLVSLRRHAADETEEDGGE